MWKCRLCKIAVGLVITILLGLLINAILSGGALGGLLSTFGISVKAGADGFGAWTAFITWLGGKFGIEGAVALKALGYQVFSAILAIGAAGLVLVADIINWLLCLICKLLGACDECKKPF